MTTMASKWRDGNESAYESLPTYSYFEKKQNLTATEMHDADIYNYQLINET